MEDHGSKELGTSGGVDTLVDPRARVKTPAFFKVVILNDDFTPQDFVVHVLRSFFAKAEPEATAIMLQVHKQGAGIAGVYTQEIAETKVFQVNSYSKKHQHPLKCVAERE